MLINSVRKLISKTVIGALPDKNPAATPATLALKTHSGQNFAINYALFKNEIIYFILSQQKWVYNILKKELLIIYLIILQIS